MPAKSVSPVATLWYENRHPEGVLRLSCKTWMSELSETTWDFEAPFVDEARG